MTLTEQEITQFYKLWCALIWGVNEKQGIIPEFEKPVYGKNMRQEPFVEIRKVLWDNPHWIDEFIRESEYGELTETDLGILADWRKNFIKDRFVLMKHLKKYSVLMTFDDPGKLYGVCGITNPLSDVIPTSALPFMIETTLLPFKHKIIYDSLIGTFQLSFGGGYRRSFKDAYNETKSTVGIIENMSMPPEQPTPTKKKPKPTPPVVDTKGANVPKNMSARYMEVAEIIEAFCDEKMNADFKELSLKALAKLCRKRPSPLASGKARTWAAGIVYAIGQLNFIFDRSQEIYMPASDIAGWFGLAKTTAGNKAAEVSRHLNLTSYYDSEFTLPCLIEKNPMTWYLTVNGFVVDMRTMPREAQVVAFNKGLIPYIPADREN